MSTRSFADELSFLDALIDRDYDRIKKYTDSYITNIRDLLKHEALRQEMIRSLEAKIYNWPWSDPDKQINALAEQIFIPQEFFVEMLDGSPNLKYRALMASPAGLRFLQRKLRLECFPIKNKDDFLRIYNQQYYTHHCRIYNDIATCARKAGLYNDVEVAEKEYSELTLDVLRGAIAGGHHDLIKEYAQKWQARPYITREFDSADGFFITAKDLETVHILHRAGIRPRSATIFKKLSDPNYDIRIVLFYLKVYDLSRLALPIQMSAIPFTAEARGSFNLLHIFELLMCRQDITAMKEVFHHPRLARHGPQEQLLNAFQISCKIGGSLDPEFKRQVIQLLGLEKVDVVSDPSLTPTCSSRT